MSLAGRSLAGAVLIAVAALLRAALGRSLPRRAFVALWWAAVVRLLAPWEISSRFSVYSLLACLRQAPAMTPPAGSGTAVRILPEAGLQTAEAVGGAAAAVPAVSPWTPAYFAGALLLTGWFAASYLLCRRKFRMSLPAENAFVSRWRQAHPRISVRVSDRISVPLTYGLLRPVILLPRRMDWPDERALAYILTHEEIHIRRLDGGTKLALAAALCVHWWNPAVWLMYVLANRDLEIACDEAVVDVLGDPVSYARTLLAMEEARAGYRPLCSCFSQNAVEERVIAMMRRKTGKYSARAIACAVLMAAGVTTAFATSARQAAAETAVTGAQSAAVPPAPTRGEILETYGPFGISFGEGGEMLFEGEPVRYFWDGAETEQGRSVCCEYASESGTVDIRAVRTVMDNGDGSVNPIGELTGIERYEESDFYALTHPATEAVAAGDGDPGGQTFAGIFERFAVFGVACEAAEGSLVNVFYNGVPVRRFVDERPDGGVFTYDSPGGGEIVLRAVYDGERLSGVGVAERETARSMIWPTDGGRVVSAFGGRDSSAGADGCFHSGIDIAGWQMGTIEGSPIYAVLAGTVADAGYDAALGRYVVLDHGEGLQTVYAACAGIAVSAGGGVQQGEVIARVGSTGLSTGPHLHFEVRQNGVTQNPQDYFSQEALEKAEQPEAGPAGS